MCYVGLAVSLFPYVVPPSITLWDAAAAPQSQAFLLIGTLFLLPVILLVWRLLREPDARPVADAWGSALLLFALAAPYLLPWYVAWFVVPLALMRDGGLIVAGVAAASVLALTGIPAEPAASPGLWRDMLLAVHYVAAPAMLVLFAITLRRVFRRPVAAAG